MSPSRTPAVRAAHARRARQRRRLKHYGQWDPWRDAEPVRAYVRELMATGLAAHRIATGSGVRHDTIETLLYGNAGKLPTVKMQTENAEKIMAFRPTIDDYSPDAPWDVTGSRRRLQALATLGWTWRALAARKGIPRDRLERIMVQRRTTTSVATARIVRDLYDELWHRRPADDEVPAWVAERARNNAVTAGWAGPLAWNDDRIDDRKARPNRGRSDDPGLDMAAVIRRLEGEDIELTSWERTAAIEYGARTRGLAFEAIAELLGMEFDSVKRTWERIKARARANGEKWPDAPRWTDPQYTVLAEAG